MTKKISFLIELASQTFSTSTADGAEVQSWIQAMPLGKYSHPIYGEIDITPDKVKRFAANVNSRVRTTELDIDYDHKEYSGEAAGWIKQAEPRDNGLWILVEWTAKAWEAIKSKAYRYFSPEFDDEWSDPKTGEKYTDVLFGGGITNRPFLKDILPLNLSEKFSELEGDKNMTPEQIKELLTLLGLGDGASFDDVKAKLEGLTKKEDPPANDGPPAKAEEPPADNSQSLLSEDDVKKLSENPVTAKLLSALEAQSKQLESQAKQFMEMKVNEAVNKLSETAQKSGSDLTPNTRTALSEIFKTVDDKTSSLITKLFENFVGGSATVKLSEPKYISRENGGSDGVKKFNDRVNEIMTEKKLSYREAAIVAAKENEDDFDTYRAEGE
ncbi:MAG TPA: phage protease [Rectinema sp.]|nr:phage protease [Rectinema sp.]